MSPPSRVGQPGKCQLQPWEDRLPSQSTLILGEGLCFYCFWWFSGASVWDYSFSGQIHRGGLWQGWWAVSVASLKLRPAWGHRLGALAGASILTSGHTWPRVCGEWEPFSFLPR